MRKIRFFIIFLVVAAAGFSFTTTAMANEVGNAGFESAFGGNNAAGNWNSEADRGINQRCTADAPEGNCYLRLTEAGTIADNFTFTFQIVGSEVHPGDFVALRAKVRQWELDDANDEGQIVIEFKDENGVRLGCAIAGTGTANTFDTACAVTHVGTKSQVFSPLIASHSAPAGTASVVVTLRIQNGENSTWPLDQGSIVDFDDLDLTINGHPIDLGVDVTKNRVPKGGASFATINLQNLTAEAQNNVELLVNVPNGLTVVDSGARLNNDIPNLIDTKQEVRRYTIGTINTHDNKTLSFLIIPSPGAAIGHRYTITLYARDSSQAVDDMKRDVLSQTRSIPITIIADPFFDEGTIIGKVFDDRNENGVQDDGEIGVPSVRLATEEGIVIITDKDGKYHIPGVQPGRHVVKIDGHTLPEGTKFITEESYLVKITDGLLGKVDFAIKLPDSKVAASYQDQLQVMVSQGTDAKRPVLSVQMKPLILKMGYDRLEQTPVFSINTNYAGIITSWRLEVCDEMGQEVWSGYGLGPPPTEAPWDGLVKTRKLISTGVYSYRLVVRNYEGYEDWTSLEFFRVVNKLDPSSDTAEIKIPETGFSNIQKEGKRSIRTSAKPTVMVRGQTISGNQVEVNGQKAEVKPDGSFEKELFIDPGKQTVSVRSTGADGKTVAYQEDVQVKDTQFFMVALGEEELGGNKFNGNFQTVGRDDGFRPGFFQQGRFAYYLKGKIKGKFLVSSRYDTSTDPRSQLFTNLDPESYYPVYGDDSQINYEARDTQERLYVLVEMDRSYVKWGSFETKFDETELATYNRTLSGVKAHYEVLDTTQYGDSKRGITFFVSKAKQVADHNEFVGTGGSLYYVRNKNVVEGSEKLAIEIRDKLQGVTISKKDLQAVTDYEIDYRQGRIILRKPLSSVADSDSILENNILGGNQVYLIVDYEYEAQDLFGDQPMGLRGYTWMGDHVRIGGTALKESREDRDYDMRGVDSLVKIGKNTKLSAEFAQSKDPQVRNGVSYNGGMTFNSIETGVKRSLKKSDRLMDAAWLVKGESKPLKSTELSGYVQKFSNGFSNADSISQKGDLKTGVEAKQKLGEDFTLKYRYDTLENYDSLTRPEVVSHTVQGIYDHLNWLSILEYRNENRNITTDPLYRGFEPVFEREGLDNGVGAKIGYRLPNHWMPYVKAQMTPTGKENNQVGAGVEATMEGKGTIRVEEMVGNLGDSTRLSYETQTPEGAKVYTHIASAPSEEASGRALSTTVGSSFQPNTRSRVYSEREISTYETGQKTGQLLGYDYDINERWKVGISGERSRINDLNEITEIKDSSLVTSGLYNTERSAGALEIGYSDHERLNMSNHFELRLDRGVTKRYQWLATPSLEWKINDDYRFLTKLNESRTLKTSDDNLDNDFTEFSTGISYRPKNNNRLNVLTRYTFLRDMGPPGQYTSGNYDGLQVDETSQIFGIEGAYDFSRFLGFVQKLGYKIGTIRSAAAADWMRMDTLLSVSRINFHITRKWDIASEYRIRIDRRLMDTMKSGILFEIDREVIDYIRFGIGYNFTDFSDDLRNSNSYTNHGFFTRLTGKF